MAGGAEDLAAVVEQDGACGGLHVQDGGDPVDGRRGAVGHVGGDEGPVVPVGELEQAGPGTVAHDDAGGAASVVADLADGVQEGVEPCGGVDVSRVGSCRGSGQAFDAGFVALQEEPVGLVGDGLDNAGLDEAGGLRVVGGFVADGGEDGNLVGVHVHFAQVGVGFRDPGAFGDDGRVQPVLDVGDAGHWPVAADGAADAGLAEDERVGRDGLGRVEGGAGPQAFLAGAGGDDVGGVRHGGVPVPHGASGTCPGMRRPCSCWLMSRCSCSRAGLPGPWRGWHGLHAAEVI